MRLKTKGSVGMHSLKLLNGDACKLKCKPTCSNELVLLLYNIFLNMIRLQLQ